MKIESNEHFEKVSQMVKFLEKKQDRSRIEDSMLAKSKEMIANYELEQI